MAKVLKIKGPKKGGPKMDSPQAVSLGKPVESSEHTSHSIDVDSKGVKHHRIHHHSSTTYEMKGDKPVPTLMNQLLSKRGK